MNKRLHPGTAALPKVINGSWQLAGGHGKVDQQKAIEALTAAAQAGFTAFDTADIYTGVEALLGRFRKQYSRRYGVEAAGRLRFHTKFVPDLMDLGKIDKRYVERIINKSLRDLGVRSLDLVQFHWWDYTVGQYVEVAGFLSELRKEGKIRELGTTNFDMKHLKELLDGGIKIQSNQIQYSLIDPRPEPKMVRFARKNGIDLYCYGTLAGGLLSDAFLRRRRPQNPSNRSHIKYLLIIDEFGGWTLFQRLLATLQRIAKRREVSISNVAAAYVLQQKAVTSVIIASRHKRNIAENTTLTSLELKPEDIREIKAVLRGSRWEGSHDIYDLERVPNGRHYSIMKYNLHHARN